MDTFLLIVSFLTLNALDFSTKIEAHALLKQSPYHAIAVPYVNAYHSGEVDHKKVNKSLQVISENTGKEVWPWIFLNNIVGYRELPKDNEKQRQKKQAFSRINGLAYKEKDADYVNFINVVGKAAEFAKKNNTGIVLDIEPYNNRQLYLVSELAEELNLEDHQVKRVLKMLGRKFIRKVAQHDPKASIWLLFSSLNQKKFYPRKLGFYERSVSYIVKGMISEIEEKEHSIKLISGGEIGVGYCHRDLTHLEKKLNKRKSNLKDYTKKDAIQLAAPIAPWIQKSNTKGWFTKGNCGKSSLETYKHFEPILERLAREYDYIWVYSSGNSDYKPFSDKKSADKLNELLGNSL